MNRENANPIEQSSRSRISTLLRVFYARCYAFRRYRLVFWFSF